MSLRLAKYTDLDIGIGYVSKSKDETKEERFQGMSEYEASQPFRSVIIDGIKAKAAIGTFGTWSERISIKFEKKHPRFGDEFTTKYFMLDEPGVLKIRNDKIEEGSDVASIYLDD